MRGPGTARRDGSDRREVLIRLVDRVRCHRAGRSALVVRDFIRGVQKPFVRTQREPRWVDGAGEHVHALKIAGGRILSQEVDAFAVIAVGADVGENRAARRLCPRGAGDAVGGGE